MKRLTRGAAVLLVVGVVAVGTGAGAAFQRVANAVPRDVPVLTVTSSLRGGHDPSGFSTDDPSAAKASGRPQRRAPIVPAAFFRALAWMPPVPVKQERKAAERTKDRCPAETTIT